MADPFEHFGDQQISHELIERNRHRLADEARDFAVRIPGVPPVALILEVGAAEARPFLEALEKATGTKLDVPGFFGLVPRSFAVGILRANCPAALDNLPNNDESTLPVLVATKSGYRFGEVDYSL